MMKTIAGLVIVDTDSKYSGNTYYLTLNRSLVLTIMCDIGYSESRNPETYFLNVVSVARNSNLKSIIGNKKFDKQLFKKSLVVSSAIEILVQYFKNEKTILNEIEMEEFAKKLVEEVFNTNQDSIEEKINLVI